MDFHWPCGETKARRYEPDTLGAQSKPQAELGWLANFVYFHGPLFQRDCLFLPKGPLEGEEGKGWKTQRGAGEEQEDSSRGRGKDAS